MVRYLNNSTWLDLNSVTVRCYTGNTAIQVGLHSCTSFQQ